jgi:hypothetical protein
MTEITAIRALISAINCTQALEFSIIAAASRQVKSRNRLHRLRRGRFSACAAL